MALLLRVAVNRDDTEALYPVLASELFAISDDALLALATTGRPGLPATRAGTPASPSLAASSGVRRTARFPWAPMIALPWL